MIKTLLKDAEAEMKKVVDTLKSEYAIRTGRATPSLLDRMVVECYGTTMPVNQVATTLLRTKVAAYSGVGQGIVVCH